MSMIDEDRHRGKTLAGKILQKHKSMDSLKISFKDKPKGQNLHSEDPGDDDKPWDNEL